MYGYAAPDMAGYGGALGPYHNMPFGQPIPLGAGGRPFMPRMAGNYPQQFMPGAAPGFAGMTVDNLPPGFAPRMGNRQHALAFWQAKFGNGPWGMRA